ncbi:MAG: hypothetical protein HYS75_03645 [Nitrosopumilales archaeon]|nr:hypothetical protein [Nitrosopumilales archaeon]
MNKKIIGVVFVVIIIILAFLMLANSNTTDQKILKQTFVIDAVYFENDGSVEVSFRDKSNKTNHVTLEILGMPESFHKEYGSSSFVEKIILTSAPKYGWQSIPVTLLVEHEEFGKIGIKTEIRPVGENHATIIFSKL